MPTRRRTFDPSEEREDPGAMPPVRIVARTPQGKIGRLPHLIREEVNTRLLNNESARSLLKWLNALPETQQVCREYWHDEPVSAKNLSDWKTGRSYAEWVEQSTRVEEIKEMMSFATSLAGAGGNIAGGLNAAIASEFMGAFEQMRREGVTLDELAAIVEPVTKLADREHTAAKLQGQREDRALKREHQREDRALKRDKLIMENSKMRKTAVAALRRLAMSPEVQAVLSSKDTTDAQNARLEQMIFGDLAASPF